MIEWWSRTRAVFPARFGVGDYEPDIARAVHLRASRFRDWDLAIWLHGSTRIPGERLAGLRSPIVGPMRPFILGSIRPLRRHVAVTGVYLTVREDGIQLKRALEWWGATFPHGGEPG